MERLGKTRHRWHNVRGEGERIGKMTNQQDQSPQVRLSFAGLSTLNQKPSTVFSTRASGWLHRMVRRFHLYSGEKHADSDRALPTVVCLLSISRPPGESS